MSATLRTPRFLAFAAGAAVLLSITVAAVRPASALREPETLFEHGTQAWVVGHIAVGKALTFRQGEVLFFPATVTEQIHAQSPNARNLSIVVEVPPGEEAPIKDFQHFVAPINVLPERAFWRDNLPNVPLHGVAGGLENLFTGEEAYAAVEVFEALARTVEDRSRERWSKEVAVVVGALDSSVQRLRDEAVRYLAGNPRVSVYFPDSSAPAVAEFLRSKATDAERIALLGAIPSWKAKGLRDVVAELSKGEGEVAEAAGRALRKIDVPEVEPDVPAQASGAADSGS